MNYDNKEILYFPPLLSPQITINAGFNLYGKEKIAKYDTKPNKRAVTHKYYLRNLAEARALENFFLQRKGMLESFFIPSYKRDFLPLDNQNAPLNAISIKNTGGGYGIYNQSKFIFLPRYVFATKLNDIVKDTKNDCEILVIKDTFRSDIKSDTLIMELLNVRFDMDVFTLSKSGAVGYSATLKFKEVFYE